MSVGFLDKLKSFKKDDVPDRIVNAVDSFIKETPELTVEEVRKGSQDAVSLCKWTYAIVNYAKVAKQVEPKRKKVGDMQAELNKAQNELNQKA